MEVFLITQLTLLVVVVNEVNWVELGESEVWNRRFFTIWPTPFSVTSNYLRRRGG